MDSTQNIISFCTGYGGIDLGLRLAGANVRTVAYVEIETFACANLVAKIEQGQMDAAPIWTDLKTFDGKPFRDRVHGIIGGYPCQPFSNAGQRKGTDDPRHLFPYICEHIRTIRPIWCFFENVGGHLSLGFKEVFASLRDMGYQVEAGLFTAAEVGASHKRERLFILASNGQGGYLVNPDSNNVETLGRGTGQRERCSAERVGGTKGLDELADDRSVYAAGTNQNGTNENGIQELSRRSPIRNEVGRCGKSDGKLADTGSQERNGLSSEQRQKDIPARNNSAWPARPGQEQHDWEEPRTVKSGMGRTINGFKSRVDQLRLLGNGVVPQTAALAWKTLTGILC